MYTHKCKTSKHAIRGYSHLSNRARLRAQAKRKVPVDPVKKALDPSFAAVASEGQGVSYEITCDISHVVFLLMTKS